LTVAIVWAGNPAHPNDHNRSLGFADIAPLLDLSEVRFLSLQQGPAAEVARRRSGGRIEFLGDEVRDFSDTAAVLHLCDLVISADTAVCHLAGALGRPVWTLLPYAPDWRWLLERDDSPWYPAMRLYRQKNSGDWPGAIEPVKRDLEELIGARQG